MGQTDDNHIFQFVASWIGYQDETDFDTRLYRCLAVFRPLSYEMYKNLSTNFALPLYTIYMILQLTFVALTLLRKWYVKEKEEAIKSGKSELSRLMKLLHKLNQSDDFRFMVYMDTSPSFIYHIGR